jgi:excisionase family DNA binding protein
MPIVSLTTDDLRHVEIESLLRVRDVARRLNVCSQTVRRWILDGRLRAARPTEHTLRVRPADLEAFLNTGALTDPPA